ELEFEAPEEAELLKRAAEWRKKTNDAYLALIRKEEGAQARVTDIWTRDQYMLTLLDTSEDSPNHPKAEKGKSDKRLLTLLVFTGLRDYLSRETSYLLARSWQEEAARFQADYQRLKADPKTPPGRLERKHSEAGDAWNSSRDAWEKY